MQGVLLSFLHREPAFRDSWGAQDNDKRNAPKLVSWMNKQRHNNFFESTRLLKEWLSRVYLNECVIN